MPIDAYADHVGGLTSPPSRAFTITPDDLADVPRATRAVMVAVGGDLSVVTVGGDTATLPGLQPGVQYAIRAARVLATGTTAAGIVGLA